MLKKIRGVCMKKDKRLYMMAFSMLCLLIAGEPVKAEGKAERQVTAVELPQNLNFYLDPDNEKGRGQIYSDQYRVRNAGEEAVTFTIDLSLSLLDDEAAIMFCPEEWSEESENRSVYMYVLFEGEQIEDKYILTDLEADCKESVVLAPAGEEGDTVYISFGGMLSRSGDWKSGELAVNALYNMSSASMGYMALIEGEHIQLRNDAGKLPSGKTAELYLIPEEGYFLPAKVQVLMNGVEIESQYDAVTGRLFLENVSGDIIIYANGITRAVLPDAEVMNTEEMLWTWEAEEGIQAYEYSFVYEEEVVKSGRIEVIDGYVSWDWSEGLGNGEYLLSLKAIGDAIYCLNSEEMSWQVTVDQDVLRPSEGDGKQEEIQPPEEDEKQGGMQPSEGDGKQEGTSSPEEGGKQEETLPPEGEGKQEEAQPSEGEGKQEEIQPPGEEGKQEEIQPPEEDGKQEEAQPPEGDGEQEEAQLSEEVEGQEGTQLPEGDGKQEGISSFEEGEKTEEIQPLEEDRKLKEESGN